MIRSEWFDLLQEKYPDLNTFSEIEHTFRRTLEIFSKYDKILISVSGGSDSDCIVHLVCTYFPEFLYKCHFVFVNTGLEYAATKRHLVDLEKKYGIEIQRIRGRSVVTVVREYGVPILSKEKSKTIRDYCKGIAYAFEKVNCRGIYSNPRFGFTEAQRQLADFIKESGILISEKCCDKSKKKPIHTYIHTYGIDVSVTGERKAEGGQRANIHKSCFEEQKSGLKKFMPLWWWSNDTKAQFKAAEGIRYSDCYEVYGMKRTGCCGCPFNINIADDLQAMFEYEPNMYKACMNVFGLAYELTDRFHCRRKKCIPDTLQMSLFQEIGKDV